jgi:hypothetical protein
LVTASGSPVKRRHSLGGGVGRLYHLLRHLSVALHHLGGGAADALAGVGECVHHLVDGAPESTLLKVLVIVIADAAWPSLAF